MKCLSVRQPWAWLIVNGYKDMENRQWSTNFRGRFLVHAARTMRRRDWYDCAFFLRRLANGAELIQKMPNPEMFGSGLSAGMLDGAGLGGIVGEAVITDCVTWSYSPWFQGTWGFVLQDAKPLPFKPCKGRLGFFDDPMETSKKG